MFFFPLCCCKFFLLLINQKRTPFFDQFCEQTFSLLQFAEQTIFSSFFAEQSFFAFSKKTYVAGGGGFSSSLRLISQLTYLLRTLSPFSFQLWEAPTQSQGQLRQEELKLKQKPYKTMDKMVVSIHYKYNSYFSTNNIGS